MHIVPEIEIMFMVGCLQNLKEVVHVYSVPKCQSTCGEIPATWTVSMISWGSLYFGRITMTLRPTVVFFIPIQSRGVEWSGDKDSQPVSVEADSASRN